MSHATTIRQRRMGGTQARRILDHYIRRGLRGEALKSAVLRHARLLEPLDRQTSEALVAQRIGTDRVGRAPWFGRARGTRRPYGA